MNCPICANKLIVVLEKKEVVKVVNGTEWSRTHSSYWCPNCEVNLMDHGAVRPDSYPKKVTSNDASFILDSIRGV